jgi:FtsP/CotA-like multicopper oxidase with cupredoxin domain
MIKVRCACLLTAVAFALLGPAFATEPAERVFELAVENGKVPKSMQVIRVTQGESVRLKLTSDRAVTLHLHGYDIERELAPGGVTEFAFRAHATGRFPVNVHERGRSAGRGHGERALLYLEVHPR